MTKKKVFTTLLAGAMVLSMALPALAGSSTETKDATVKFKSDSSALQFDPSGMPVGLNFGERTASAVAKYYPEITAAGITIKIKDERGGGANSGWRLTAELGKFVNGTFDLAGASITMRSGATPLGVITHNPNWGSAAPTMASSVTLPSDGIGTPVLILHADGMDPLATAGAGVGDTELKFTMFPSASTVEDTNPNIGYPIELYVPGATARAGEYKANLIWTLNDTP